ncbi:glycosyltransferase family 2 protein [Lacrimispora saccharolytica]|uniref:Glycosyl transferase family 2 n=1 Tax=Lacrimispora saccharolytica (strain ATCC 35040 / DSM 2544 / NRCC 2533 / WM1) TaxID=610130 RepID=D9R0B1_LACSW|nr:glycosyltransferase [Lacrimispora saccharolytica]ADL06344.1 glycosyl transferase family 2 [[Clostridium] saccharolyticum WM1]QRV19558.1 glycosyltransferase [Lacrimispora saccharolytica]
MSGVDGSKIMASISCLTFNHGAYIRQALDSFLMQKTNFEYEILVHDDASTDGTGEILREYGEKYPDKVKPLIQRSNQYSQGIDNISGAFNFPRVRGKYIFMCDGDDYWISPDKMQKQVDYLEAHPDCTLCIHSAEIELVGKALTEKKMRPYRGNRVITPEEIVDKPSGYAMSSMAFPSRLVKELPDYYVDCPVGDTPLQMMAAAQGYCYYMDEPMSAYRVGVAGSWTSEGKSGDYARKQQIYWERMKKVYEEFDAATEGRLRQAAESAAKRTYYHTMVNTRQFKEIMNPEYRRYYKELTARTRFFIQAERCAPGAYGLLRRMFLGKNG